MRACPFCGCLNSIPCYNGIDWYVSCDGCLARGPPAPTRSQAELYWDRVKLGSNQIGRPIIRMGDENDE